MSLQFIFGNSGFGKTTAIYEKIIKESMEHPEMQYYCIVPEQFTLQTQRDFVMMHPRKGIFNIDVLSFLRLAHHVFEEVGENGRIILEETGKNILLRKLAKEYEAQLKVLGRNIKKLGYISEVKSLISEKISLPIPLSNVFEYTSETIPQESNGMDLQIVEAAEPLCHAL